MGNNNSANKTYDPENYADEKYVNSEISKNKPL